LFFCGKKKYYLPLSLLPFLFLFFGGMVFVRVWREWESAMQLRGMYFFFFWLKVRPPPGHFIQEK